MPRFAVAEAMPISRSRTCATCFFILDLSFVREVVTICFGRPGLRKRSIFRETEARPKPYQVRQVRNVILKYKLGEERLMDKYEIIIYWSDEDQAFVAEVPELPGCMAHGNTHEEALANAKAAMQLWIDTANEFGDPIPEPRDIGWSSHDSGRPHDILSHRRSDFRRRHDAAQLHREDRGGAAAGRDRAGRFQQPDRAGAAIRRRRRHPERRHRAQGVRLAGRLQPRDLRPLPPGAASIWSPWPGFSSG